jgi:site-specific recombinase XerD
MEATMMRQEVIDPAAGPVPAVLAGSGERAVRRALEWFAARLTNPNTRRAYAKVVSKFCQWCREVGLRRLEEVEPVHVARFLNALRDAGASRATRRQHLSAIRGFFTDLLSGGALDSRHNPALAVRGPRMVIDRGKTPILSAAEARRLLAVADPATLAGLRDRALIGLMLYTFARVSAAAKLDVSDYRRTAEGAELIFREKGGRQRIIPVHPQLREYLDAYLETTGIRSGPLFRTAPGSSRRLSHRRMARADIYRMVRRRAKAADLETQGVSAHSLRGTGITQYRREGGSLEVARKIAGHKDIRTTRLYDHSGMGVELHEIERLRF